MNCSSFLRFQVIDFGHFKMSCSLICLVSIVIYNCYPWYLIPNLLWLELDIFFYFILGVTNILRPLSAEKIQTQCSWLETVSGSADFDAYAAYVMNVKGYSTPTTTTTWEALKLYFKISQDVVWWLKGKKVMKWVKQTRSRFSFTSDSTL